MWSITSIETEQVDEIDFVSEEAQAKADLLEICTGLFDEVAEDFNWQGFSVHLITEGSVDQICDQIGQNSTAGAEMREEEHAPIGFVRYETREVFFFPHIAVEILWNLGTLQYTAIEEFVRAYIKHEHRHVLQLHAFERAGLDLGQVWKKSCSSITPMDILVLCSNKTFSQYSLTAANGTLKRSSVIMPKHNGINEVLKEKYSTILFFEYLIMLLSRWKP